MRPRPSGRGGAAPCIDGSGRIASFRAGRRSRPPGRDQSRAASVRPAFRNDARFGLAAVWRPMPHARRRRGGSRSWRLLPWRSPARVLDIFDLAGDRQGVVERDRRVSHRVDGLSDGSQATTVDRPTSSVLALELLVDCQEVHVEGEEMAALAWPVATDADGMGDGFRALERMKVIAAAAAIDEVEVVVVVPDAQPAQGRGTPPLLVVEADLVAEPRLAVLTGDQQVRDNRPNPFVRPKVPQVDPPDAIEPAEESIATLVERVRRKWPHAPIGSTAGSCPSSSSRSASGSSVIDDDASCSGSSRRITARTGIR